jgi:pyrroloquinoline quinone biosynthesis protein D
VGDGVVVLLADSGQLFTGNATTEAVLRLVDGRRRVSEIGAGLCMEFDVELDDAVGDVLGVAADLVEERVLVVVG